jgi:alkylation response protein AidB-like acyl-CoA dehydrogenase
MDLSLAPEDEAFAAEFRQWLEDNAPNPPGFVDLAEEVAWGRRWQARLAQDRWVGVHWPVEYGGRGATPVQVALYQSEYARAGAPQPVNRVGINLVGPTLLAHGTDEQRHRWMPNILSATEVWCQLFSEPEAGSDLSSLSTRAVATDGGYLVTGAKVWTSYAQFAQYGLCLARTDPEAFRPQQGISALVVDMTSPGVEIRPLLQLTGDSEFNEVFLDEVFVPLDQLVGIEGHGWEVAGSTLAHERGTSFPFKEQIVHENYLNRMLREAAASGALDEPMVADALVSAYVELEVLRLHNLRTLTRLGRGEAPGPESSWVKLAWTQMTQTMAEASLMAVGRDPSAALAGPWTRQWLWSRAASIAGGTSEIQRDIIAGRILGLPRG